MFIFEWDEEKEKLNLRKHRIGFTEAQTVFTDQFHVTFPDEYHSIDEERFITIGLSNMGNILLVVHTEVSEIEDMIRIRIISCRKATPLERKIYDEN